MRYVRGRVVDAVLLATAVAICVGAYRGHAVESFVAASPYHRITPHIGMSSETLDTIAARVVNRNAFGTPRAPSVGSLPVLPNANIPIPAGVFTTPITIQAIAGPPWVAVLSGLPGRATQSMVLPGDTIASYRIRSISRDSVTIQAPDSLIRLSFARTGN